MTMEEGTRRMRMEEELSCARVSVLGVDDAFFQWVVSGEVAKEGGGFCAKRRGQE